MEQLSLPAELVSSFIVCLSRQPGFVQFTGRPGSEQRYSAWPRQRWCLPADRAGFEATIAEIQRAHDATGLCPDGGAIAGVIGYEAGRHTQPGFETGRQALPHGLGYVGHYLWQLTIGGIADPGAARLVFHPLCPQATRLQVKGLINQIRLDDPEIPGFYLTAPFSEEHSAHHYQTGVARVLDLISAGDCYQVNLSQKFTTGYCGHPFSAFQALIEAIPVPHSAYIDAGDFQVLSISPEMFLDIDNGAVTSKPIKGTRPRDAGDPTADLALAEELKANPKDRAENLMIVDLIRNDLAHFCQPFSIKVPKLFEIESYRNVHQLVSTVTGQLNPEVSPLTALLSAFPGGSITGAPKKRAMEIIEELEDHQRGPYCGSVFWWDYQNSLESNIAIRTLMTDASGGIHCWAGCGIVADSDPREEYDESVTKVRRLMDTLESKE